MFALRLLPDCDTVITTRIADFTERYRITNTLPIGPTLRHTIIL